MWRVSLVSHRLPTACMHGSVPSPPLPLQHAIGTAGLSLHCPPVLSRYESLLASIDKMSVEELVMAVRWAAGSGAMRARAQAVGRRGQSPCQGRTAPLLRLNLSSVPLSTCHKAGLLLLPHHRRQSQGFSRGTSTYRGVTHHPSGRWEARIGGWGGW